MLEKPKSKFDVEEMRKSLEEVTIEDILPMVLVSIDLLRVSGDMLIATGKLQNKSQKLYDYALKVGEDPQSFLAMFVEKIPAEKLKPLLNLMLRLTSVFSRMKDSEKLNGNEKIALGEELVQISDEMKRIIKGE